MNKRWVLQFIIFSSCFLSQNAFSGIFDIFRSASSLWSFSRAISTPDEMIRDLEAKIRVLEQVAQRVGAETAEGVRIRASIRTATKNLGRILGGDAFGAGFNEFLASTSAATATGVRTATGRSLGAFTAGLADGVRGTPSPGGGRTGGLSGVMGAMAEEVEAALRGVGGGPSIGARLGTALGDEADVGLGAATEGLAKGMDRAGKNLGKGLEEFMGESSHGFGAGLKEIAGNLRGAFWSFNFGSLFFTYLGVTSLAISVPLASWLGVRYMYNKMLHNLKSPGFIAETDFVPLFKRPFSRRPEVGDLNDFVAPEEFKQKIFAYVKQLKMLRESKSNAGIMALFYGPYGVGKTFVAKIIARAAGLNFAVIRGSSIRDNKNFAKMLAEKFAWARANNIILIIDEAEEVLGAAQDQSTDRMVLNELIGAMGTPEKRPHMIIMTNHPGKLNRAFVGKGGRIDRFLEFPAPDAAAVKDMLKKMIGAQIKALKLSAKDLDLAKVAEAVGIRPGREIFGLVVEACLQAKVEKKTLSVNNFEAAAKLRDVDRAALASFRLPGVEAPQAVAAAA
jgi:hypothetical protein